MKVAPRLRMFAGPNGSGKSTIKAVVESAIGSDLFGIYINPGEIEELIRRSGNLDVSAFGVDTRADEILGFFKTSPFLAGKGLVDKAAALTFEDGKLNFSEVEVDSYLRLPPTSCDRDCWMPGLASRLKLSCLRLTRLSSCEKPRKGAFGLTCIM